eukprot:546233-Pleurochrysis_carterae.AAC.1
MRRELEKLQRMPEKPANYPAQHEEERPTILWQTEQQSLQERPLPTAGNVRRMDDRYDTCAGGQPSTPATPWNIVQLRAEQIRRARNQQSQKVDAAQMRQRQVYIQDLEDQLNNAEHERAFCRHSGERAPPANRPRHETPFTASCSSCCTPCLHRFDAQLTSSDIVITASERTYLTIMCPVGITPPC